MADDGELPPDVLSEEGSGSGVSLHCLPLGPKCACKKMCEEKLSLQAVLDSRQEHLNLSEEDRAGKFLLQLVCRCATEIAR